MGLVNSLPFDDAKVVQLAPCPYCSHPPSSPSPQINRPLLVTGRSSGKVFISGCCGFSGASRKPYENGQQAIDAWMHYRQAASKKLAEMGDLSIISRLHELDGTKPTTAPDGALAQ